MSHPTTTTTPHGMSPGAAFLFALAGGAAVGNLYWSQPILDVVASTFGMTAASAGILITGTQIGYAVGVFFLVPLGDMVNRKVFIPAMMLLAAIMLAVSAVAPTFLVLLITLTLVGVSTVSGQLLAPLAGDLSTDRQRGRVLGTVASGIMLGILVARAISGILTDLIGWRALYGIVAVLMLVMAAVMYRALPALPRRDHVPYFGLLLSVLRTFVTSATARAVMFIGATAMTTFTLFWTAMTFLLTSAPFEFSATQIGLMSLIGIAGALAAQQVGKLYDRGLGVLTIGGGLVLAITAFAISGFAPSSIIAVVASIAVYSVGVQTVQVMAQTRMMAIDPAARSRLNTLFVVGNFVGGAIGSALASALWNFGGWSVVMGAATAILLVALVTWAVQRRRALA